MSVVAVKINKNKIELCSDSFVGGQYEQSKIAFVKSFQINGLTIGGVGTATEISLLKIFSENHTPKTSDEDSVINFFVEFSEWCKKKDVNFRVENDWILIYKNKVFFISGLWVREIKDYCSIGAGKFFSDAVLYLGNSAEEAVNVACELSPWCEKPINKFELKYE